MDSFIKQGGNRLLRDILLSYLQGKGKIVYSEDMEVHVQQRLPHEYITYQMFAEIVQAFEKEGILVSIGRGRSESMNGRNPRLYKKYHNSLAQPRNVPVETPHISLLHKNIDLSYYKNKPSAFTKVKSAIEAMSNFLKGKGETNKGIWEINERSLDLFGHEKWLKENKRLLERIGLSDKDLGFRHSPEPFAYRRSKGFCVKDTLSVLIIENKDTYMSLERLFKEGVIRFGDTSFDLLVYGAGKRVYSSIRYLYSLDEYVGQSVHCEYFGDLDAEGISMWFRVMHLHPDIPITPCTFLYTALLTQARHKTRSLDGAAQREVEGMHVFAAAFPNKTVKEIEEIIYGYQILPQEGLHYELLQKLGEKDV